VGDGLYAMFTIPVEAFPDLTNNQIVVVTEAPGMAPGEVEITIAILGIVWQSAKRSWCGPWTA